MSYRVVVKVITGNFEGEFGQRCSEFETELQDDSVYEYYTDYSVRADATSVTGVLCTAIFRIYYEEQDNPVAVAYGGKA